MEYVKWEMGQVMKRNTPVKVYQIIKEIPALR